MKTTRILAVSFVLVFVIAACQKTTSPMRPNSPAATPNVPPASSGQPEQIGGANNGTDNGADAGQPDDPGMTSDHDKTLKQEQPSGDESSQAAPNDGDAEPPQ